MYSFKDLNGANYNINISRVLLYKSRKAFESHHFQNTFRLANDILKLFILFNNTNNAPIVLWIIITILV